MDEKSLSCDTDLFRRSRNQRKSALDLSIQALIVHGCALVGGALLFIAACSKVNNALWKDSHTKTRTPPIDIYPDTDYPLRPAKEPWDISTSYQYPKKLSKTVTEGTWLRIATHPTRPEIVFDMLGDLYCMSIDAAVNDLDSRSAYPILTGIAYEKEAEFSLNGDQLVFISDAGFGVDNIWTMSYTTCYEMHRAGSSTVRRTMIQQTNSTFRFFSSPAFHPTEPRLIATKWYLTGRPNGAGELWEFPLLSQSQSQLPERGGHRLVGRKLPSTWVESQYFESQLGAEQGRYSPDGIGVIYTRNVRDDAGGKFTYSKDVHAGINAVFQCDLISGHVSELISAAPSLPNKPASPGGANMPRLSRDGKTLAFVRRKDEKEVLALKDMRSGTVHYVWDELEYDLSTIPAFMGAYPNYGWTSNDSAIIIWSQGQIWRIDLAINTRGERIAKSSPFTLKFEAKIDLNLAKTRYSEVNITKDELAHHRRESAFRGLRSDHTGRQAVFEAAGDNHLVQINTGTVTALAKPSSEQSCYSPSFIEDTALILQACWDDEGLTSFYIVDANSDHIRRIEGLPRGRYVSPVANPDVIAYVRTGKDYMFGDIEETSGHGIWVANLQLSTSELSITSEPQLLDIPGATANTKLIVTETILRVQTGGSLVEYYLTRHSHKRSLASVTAVELTASDSSAVAFRDFQHIWLCKSPVRNQLDIRSKPRDVKRPEDLIRLSQIGGHDVTFSGDGRKIFWLLGSTLHWVDVQNVMDGCYAASLESRDAGMCAKRHVQRHNLNVTFKTGLSKQMANIGAKSFVITNATLVAMSSHFPRVLANAAVVVRNGQIVAAGPSKSILFPPSSEVLDVQGGIVMPGLIDVHGHWGGFLTPYPLHSWEMETFLGYGVTTIHNPASHNVNGPAERTRIEKGQMYGPRVFVTGDVLYGSTQPSVYTEINSRQDARDALLRIKAEGGESSFSAKNYQLPSRSARQRLLLEAAELNMLVVPEGGWSFDWGLTYFMDGYTTHEHPLPVPNLYNDVLSLIQASGSSYTPLAVMNYGGIFGQHWVHQSVDIPGDTKLRRYVKHDILEGLTEVKQAPKSSYHFFNTSRSTARLAQLGVRTNVGAHGEQPIGLLYHWEMRMMEMGGQDPYAILRSATIGGATSLGLNASLGSIEAGKLADLVVYPPGVDTIERLWESSMDMKYVMSRGTLFSVEDGLVEEWPRQGRRQRHARFNAEDD